MWQSLESKWFAQSQSHNFPCRKISILGLQNKSPRLLRCELYSSVARIRKFAWLSMSTKRIRQLSFYMKMDWLGWCLLAGNHIAQNALTVTSPKLLRSKGLRPIRDNIGHHCNISQFQIPILSHRWLLHK